MPVVVWCFNNNEEKEHIEEIMSKFIANKIATSTTEKGIKAVIDYLESGEIIGSSKR